MALKRNSYTKDIQDECKRLLSYHIILTMADGIKLDGIIESVDTDSITVLVGEDVIQKEGERRYERNKQYGDHRRFRRYRPRFFPYGSLAGLSLLLYLYFAPPYPY